MRTCPACERPISSELIPFCPHCGRSLEVQDPRTGWARANVDLRAVASWQRRIIYPILLQCIALFLTGALGSQSRGSFFVVFVAVVYFGSLIGVALVAWQLLGALRATLFLKLTASVFCVAPCISLLMLVVVNLYATKALRDAGLKVGLMGISDDEVVRGLAPFICRNCGYSLIGNISGVCPECGTPVSGS